MSTFTGTQVAPNITYFDTETSQWLSVETPFANQRKADFALNVGDTILKVVKTTALDGGVSIQQDQEVVTVTPLEFVTSKNVQGAYQPENFVYLQSSAPTTPSPTNPGKGHGNKNKP